MFIIFGWRGIARTISEGMFFCPDCEGDRRYAQKSSRRWFTLFFIPVIPLNPLGSHIECQQCESTYSERVLQIPTTTQIRAVTEVAVRSSFAGTALADGWISPFEADCAVALSAAWFAGYTHQQFSSDVATFDSGDLFRSLHTLRPTINEHGKDRLLQALTLVAAADGNIDDAEHDRISIIANALGVPQSYLPGIMKQALTYLREDNMSPSAIDSRFTQT